MVSQGGAASLCGFEAGSLSASSQHDGLSCGQRARQLVAHVWEASILSQYYRIVRVQLELGTHARFGFVRCYWDT